MNFESLKSTAQTIVNSLDRIKLDFKIEFDQLTRQGRIYLEKNPEAFFYKMNPRSYWECDCLNKNCCCKLPDGPQYLLIITFDGEHKSRYQVMSEIGEVLMLASELDAVGTNIVCISCGFRVKTRPQ